MPQVTRLEEQSSTQFPQLANTLLPLFVLPWPSGEQWSISKMDHCPRNKCERRQEIGQQFLLKAVILEYGTHEKVFVELIRRSWIEDAQIVYECIVRIPEKILPVVIESLCEFSTGLDVDEKTTPIRITQKRRISPVIDLTSSRCISAESKPVRMTT